MGTQQKGLGAVTLLLTLCTPQGGQHLFSGTMHKHHLCGMLGAGRGAGNPRWDGGRQVTGCLGLLGHREESVPNIGSIK